MIHLKFASICTHLDSTAQVLEKSGLFVNGVFGGSGGFEPFSGSYKNAWCANLLQRKTSILQISVKLLIGCDRSLTKWRVFANSSQTLAKFQFSTLSAPPKTPNCDATPQSPGLIQILKRASWILVICFFVQFQSNLNTIITCHESWQVLCNKGADSFVAKCLLSQSQLIDWTVNLRLPLIVISSKLLAFFWERKDTNSHGIKSWCSSTCINPNVEWSCALPHDVLCTYWLSGFHLGPKCWKAGLLSNPGQIEESNQSALPGFLAGILWSVATPSVICFAGIKKITSTKSLSLVVHGFTGTEHWWVNDMLQETWHFVTSD